MTSGTSSSIVVSWRPMRSPQYDARTVRAVIRRYLRTSGTEAETRSGFSAVMNTSAVKSSASGWLPTLPYINRYPGDIVAVHRIPIRVDRAGHRLQARHGLGTALLTLAADHLRHYDRGSVTVHLGVERIRPGADDEQEDAAAQHRHLQTTFVEEVPEAALFRVQRGMAPQQRHLGDR